MFLTNFLANLKVRRKLGLLMGLVVIGFAALFYTALEEIAEVREAFPLYAKALANAHSSERLSLLRLALSDIHAILGQARYTAEVDELRSLQRKAQGLSSFVSSQFHDLLQTDDDDIKTSLLSAKLTWDAFWMTSERMLQELLEGSR